MTQGVRNSSVNGIHDHENEVLHIDLSVNGYIARKHKLCARRKLSVLGNDDSAVLGDLSVNRQAVGIVSLAAYDGGVNGLPRLGGCSKLLCSSEVRIKLNFSRRAFRRGVLGERRSRC